MDDLNPFLTSCHLTSNLIFKSFHSYNIFYTLRKPILYFFVTSRDLIPDSAPKLRQRCKFDPAFIIPEAKRKPSECYNPKIKSLDSALACQLLNRKCFIEEEGTSERIKTLKRKSSHKFEPAKYDIQMRMSPNIDSVRK